MRFKFKFKTISSRFLVFFILMAAIVGTGSAVIFMSFEGSNMWFGGAALLTGSLILSWAFASMLSNNIKSSLHTLIEVARAVERGEKCPAINLRRRDEFASLADAMNGMLDRDKAVRDANEDPLTGLANRRYLTQRLEDLFKRKKQVTVMFIDLDGFKPINDKYGHDVGDEALRIASDRMGACVRESDILARIGGDEFIIAFVGLHEKDVLKERGDKVLEMVSTPMWIAGNRIRMGASIGIGISPEDGKTCEEIINSADEAMYAAKQGGKNAYRFYS